MGKKKQARKKCEARIIAALVNPQPPDITIDGPDLDPLAIWRETAIEYSAGFVEEDGRGWNPNRYL